MHIVFLLGLELNFETIAVITQQKGNYLIQQQIFIETVSVILHFVSVDIGLESADYETHKTNGRNIASLCLIHSHLEISRLYSRREIIHCGALFLHFEGSSVKFT